MHVPAHRQLKPDAALFERRLSGADLRELADAYGVAPSTLSRFFRSPAGTQGLEAARRAATAATSGLDAPSAPESAPSPAETRGAARVTPLALRPTFGAVWGVCGEVVVFVSPLERAHECIGYRHGEDMEGTGPFDDASRMLHYLADYGDLVLDPSTPGRVTYPLRVAEGRQRLVIFRGCYEQAQVARLARQRRWDYKMRDRPEHERRGLVCVGAVEIR